MEINWEKTSNWVRFVIMAVSVYLIINVLFWAIEEWPKNMENPSEKGFLYWGQKENFDYSHPKLVERNITLGLILLAISFLISLFHKEKRKWYRKNIVNLFVNFICVIIEIFSASIITLALFSGLKFQFVAEITLTIISFVLFLGSIDLQRQYPIE